VDRFTVLVQAVRAAARRNLAVAARAGEVVTRYERKRDEYLAYAVAHGDDSEEISGWCWSTGKEES